MSETDLTETQFNDILATMWMAGIQVPGMTFNVHKSQWHFIEEWTTEKVISNVVLYDSDFGKVFLRKE